MAGDFGCEWRRRVLRHLQERGARETRPFADLVAFSSRLFDSVDGLRADILQLNVHKDRLQRDLLELQHGPVPEGGSLPLEKKVFQLQEELTELHKKKGEHSQLVIDLRNTLERKEKEYDKKTVCCNELSTALESSQSTCKDLHQKLSELESEKQMLKDDHVALQLNLNSLEDKYLRLEKDHEELLRRWIDLKRQEADIVNAENERFFYHKQLKLQKELEEAAREPVVVAKADGDGLPSYCAAVACIPNRIVYKLEAHEGEVNAVCWSASGKLVATGGGDRKVKFWEMGRSDGFLKGTLTGSNAAVMSVTFDQEETLVLAASNDFASRVWTVSDQRLRHTLTGHSGKVLAAKFLGESSKVVSGSHDRTLKIWDLRSRACIRTLFTGSSCNDLVTCDGTGSNIISGHFDRRIRFWDGRSDRSNNEVLLQGKVTSLDLAVGGTLLLVCSRDDTLKLIDLRMNQVVGTFCVDGFKVGCDWTRAKFSPDGQFASVGSQDGALYIWNTTTGKLEKVLKDQGVNITACCWSPHGNYIISCEKNKKIALWSDL